MSGLILVFREIIRQSFSLNKISFSDFLDFLIRESPEDISDNSVIKPRKLPLKVP